MKNLKKFIALLIIVALGYLSLSEITVYSFEEVTKESVTNISDLKYEKIENSVTITGYIGNEEKVVIPKKIEDIEVTKIGNSAFKGSKIKEIEIPFIKEVGKEAFLDSSNLEAILLAKDVIVNEDAFKTTNVKKITINYKEENIDKKTIDDWSSFVKGISGVNINNVTGKFIKNNQYTKNLDDTVGPIITLNGDALIKVEIGSGFKDQGATAYDKYENKNVDVSVEGSVDISKLGEYSLTYTANDSSRNTTTITRVVKVVDTTRPIIIFNGEKEITIEAKGKYVEPGAIGKDILDGKVEVKISGEVDTSKVGEYKISYTTSDKAGNKASAIRIVKVVDTKAPIITLNGEREVTIETGEKYEELGAVAKDVLDGEIDVTISGEVDNTKVGEYKVTYTAVDNSKNSSTEVRNIKVVEKEGSDEITTDENGDLSKFNEKYIISGIIGGIVVVIGVVIVVAYYRKKK